MLLAAVYLRVSFSLSNPYFYRSTRFFILAIFSGICQTEMHPFWIFGYSIALLNAIANLDPLRRALYCFHEADRKCLTLIDCAGFHEYSFPNVAI